LTLNTNKETTMKATDAFPGSYLKKEDAATPLRLVIETVTMEDVNTDDGKEKKAVMHFADGRSKPMILNRSNWSILEEAYGLDSDDWSGRPVEVCIDPSVMYAGKRIGGLRVRIPDASPPPSLGWTLDQAVSLASQAGLSKETVLSNLKMQGINAWNIEKCTPLVKDMIAKANEQPF
jgi:hypothetical protein